jgi:hypothetical protein
METKHVGGPMRRHLVVVSALFLSMSATGCLLHREHPLQGQAAQSLSPGTELLVRFVTARSVALTNDDGSQSSREDVVKLRARFQQFAGDTIVLRVTTVFFQGGVRAPVISESRLVIDSTVMLQQFRVDPVRSLLAGVAIVAGAAMLAFIILAAATFSGESY